MRTVRWVLLAALVVAVTFFAVSALAGDSTPAPDQQQEAFDHVAST